MTTTYDPKLHKIVPIEPTEEMLHAVVVHYMNDAEDKRGSMCGSYKAMLSAAPEITLNQWQDISLLPEEFKNPPFDYFMAYRPRVKAPCAVFYEGSLPNMVCEPESGKTWIATRFMPLPTPPEN